MKQRQRPKIQHKMEYSPLTSTYHDDSDEETELLVRRQFQDVPTIDKVVEEGDTLQSLSIRYHCPIAELKRLNNIHRENEIFAKRSIKVPARSFLTLATVHVSGSNSPKKEVTSKGIDAEILESKLNTKLNSGNSSALNAISDILSNQLEVNEVIFNSDLKPVTRIFENVPTIPPLINTNDEEIHLLPRSEVVNEPVITRLSCNGADADISWIALFICVVVTILAIPLIYVFYIAEHPEQYHHSNS